MIHPMKRPNQTPDKFICDSMLGGLARWLRAAGYDAEFHYDIDDCRLVELTKQSGRMLLSCDDDIFRRNVIRNGEIPALRVPRQLSRVDALRFVMNHLGLRLRRPRCMSCGGELIEVPKHRVMSEAPPLAYKNCDKFWRCRRCGKLFWRGTHWKKIADRLEQIR